MMKSSLGPPPTGKDALRTLQGFLRRTKPEEKEKKGSSQWLSRLNLLNHRDSTYISTAENYSVWICNITAKQNKTKNQHNRTTVSLFCYLQVPHCAQQVHFFPPYFCLCTAKRDHKSILIEMFFNFSVRKFESHNVELWWYASLAITETATRGR